MTSEVPAHLIDEIAAGRCVAFVGAGFSAPAVPAWGALLEGLRTRAVLDAETGAWLDELIAHGGARDLEAAAQILQGALGPAFDPALAEVLVEQGRPERIAERRRLLAGIPFDSILTTNFDHFLEGEVPGSTAYRRVLRDPANRWWEPRYWKGDGGAPVVKLHGEVGPVGDDVVFTQRDYRERLYRSAAYMTFLRSVFATSTVLFLGVSFTDAYLNELRSEILAMLDHDPDDDPVAYAVLADVKPHQQRYLRDHEGLGVIGFDTSGGTDWSGFEARLRQIHDATNPRALLGRAISGRRILWVDPDDSDRAQGAAMLRESAESAGGSTAVHQVATASEALEHLATHGADLVIADWPLAEGLLQELHRSGRWVPVVVFASQDGAAPDRARAIGLGATDALGEWADLFCEITRVLG